MSPPYSSAGIAVDLFQAGFFNTLLCAGKTGEVS